MLLSNLLTCLLDNYPGRLHRNALAQLHQPLSHLAVLEPTSMQPSLHFHRTLNSYLHDRLTATRFFLLNRLSLTRLMVVQMMTFRLLLCHLKTRSTMLAVNVLC